MEYFNTSRCIEKSNCANANTISCNNCNRNLKPLKDNFKMKGLTFTYKESKEGE